MTREFSEDDVRIRPGRRSRPRSKERPDYTSATSGLVVAVDRGRLTVDLGPGEPTLTAVRARELGRRSVVVGDRVGLVGDLSGAEGSLARIVRLDPRSSALRRTPDDSDPEERIVPLRPTPETGDEWEPIATGTAPPEHPHDSPTTGLRP